MNRAESRETSASHSPRSYSTESTTDQQNLPLGLPVRDKSSTRLKRAHNKVRTGCLTCRKRRVKCDEKKPRCDRCLKADQTCEGYGDTGEESLEPCPRNAESTTLLPRPNLSNFSAFLDENDMADPFVAFLETTAPRMSACFASMLGSVMEDKLTVLHLTDKVQYLWKTLIPSACQYDPATRFGAVALSSLHQSLESCHHYPWQSQPFAKYYNKAISSVKEGRCLNSHDQVLLPCVLFAHCELLMGTSEDAMAHVLSGRRIISGLREIGGVLPDNVTRVIEPVLSAFVAQSQISGTGNTGFYFPTTLSALQQEIPSFPKSFSSLASASSSLNDVLYRTLLLQELGQPCDRDLAIATRRYANNWSIAFDAFRSAPGNGVPEMKRWHLLLLAEHRMIQLLLKSMPPEADANFQRAEGDFQVMLAQLKTFLTEQAQHTGIVQGTAWHLPVSPGYIMPLFFICLHSRNREIRVAASDLLRALKVTEGHWNSCLAYSIASKTMELDEKHTQRMPASKLSGAETRRIKPMSLERVAGDRLQLQHVKPNSDGGPSDSVAALIERRICHQNVNPSWALNTMLRCHGFQGVVRTKTLLCDCDSP